MRSIISILVGLLFIGCGQKRTSIDEYKKYETEQLASGEKYNEIFLGFQLGDSYNETQKHLRLLKDRKEIQVEVRSLRDMHDYYYFVIDSTSALKAYIDFSYLADSLTVLTLKMPNGNSDHFDKITELYKNKYGDFHYKQTALNRKQIRWSHGNRIIGLGFSNDGIEIEYGDLAMIRKKKEELMIKQKQESKETENNI